VVEREGNILFGLEGSLGRGWEVRDPKYSLNNGLM